MANLDEMLATGLINQDQYSKYKQVQGGLAPIEPATPANIQAFDANQDSQRLALNSPQKTANDRIRTALGVAPINPEVENQRYDAMMAAVPKDNQDDPGHVSGLAHPSQNDSLHSVMQSAAISSLPPVGSTKTSTPTPPIAPSHIAMGPAVNPYQGLIDNLNKHKDFMLGTPGKAGNSSNLSEAEQTRLNQIDQAEQNGTIPKSQADLLRQAVQKSAISRTTEPGQKGYFDKLSDNVNKQSDLEQGIAAQQALLAKVYNETATDADKAELATHNQNLATLQKKADDINAFITQAPEYKEDPKRYWKDMGAGRQIGFGIMALISGVASGLANKESHAFDQLNKEIDRDIDAQRKTYEAASDKFKTQLLGKNQDFARAQQLAGKSEDAARILKLQKLDEYTRNMDVLAKTSGSEQVKLAAEKANINLEKEKAKTQFELYQSQWQLLHPPARGGSPATTQAKADEQAAAEFTRRKDLQLPALNSALSNLDKVIANPDGAVKWSFSGPSWMPGTEQRRENEARAAMSRAEIAKALFGPTVTEGDQALVDRFLPDNPTMAQLKVAREALSERIKSGEAEVAGGTTAVGAAVGDARRKATKATQPQSLNLKERQ